MFCLCHPSAQVNPALTLHSTVDECCALLDALEISLQNYAGYVSCRRPVYVVNAHATLMKNQACADNYQILNKCSAYAYQNINICLSYQKSVFCTYLQ